MVSYVYRKSTCKLQQIQRTGLLSIWISYRYFSNTMDCTSKYNRAVSIQCIQNGCLGSTPLYRHSWGVAMVFLMNEWKICSAPFSMWHCFDLFIIISLGYGHSYPSSSAWSWSFCWAWPLCFCDCWRLGGGLSSSSFRLIEEGLC